jgi:putative ABC transport system permease protein
VSVRDWVRFTAGALRGHRLRTWLSVTGVAIGVASVILLTSLGEGARLYVTGEFASLGSNLLIVIPGKTETFGAAPFVNTAPNDLTVDDAEALVRRVPQIRRAAPISLGTAAAEFGERSRQATIIGTTYEALAIRHLAMGTGRFLPEGVRDAPVCVIGAAIQTELFGNENPLGKMIRVGGTRFRMIGMNMDEVVDIPVDTGLRLFNRTSLFRVLAEVTSAREMDGARKRVIQVLTERHGEEDVTVLTQDAVLSTFDRILKILTAALAGIAAVSLTVAGIGIMNVMLVSVSERTREIGLLKALGTTARQIVTVFLLEAAVISTLGGALGLILGLGGGRIFEHFVPAFSVRPPWWAVALALAVSAAVGLLFGSLPARNASRLDPVEALMRKRA